MALPPIRISGRLYRVPLQEPARTMELYRLLRMLVDLNLEQFRSGLVKPIPVMLSGIRYTREPRGREHWQTAVEMQRSKKADCEDLSAYEAARLVFAGLRKTTVDLEANQIGWHVVVRLPDRRVWDPSIACGMGRDDERI